MHDADQTPRWKFMMGRKSVSLLLKCIRSLKITESITIFFSLHRWLLGEPDEKSPLPRHLPSIAPLKSGVYDSHFKKQNQLSSLFPSQANS